jgi:hypothetical protein
MDRGKQHWVPRSYLAAWCDPDTPANHDPYVWLLPKEGGTGRRKAPENAFAETDFYTVHLLDGRRDLSLEQGLGTLEDRFCRIRNARIANREPLNNEERVWLCAFIAAMHARTRAQRNALQQQWSHALTVAEDLQQALDRMSPAQRRQHRPPTVIGETTGPSLTIDDVRKLADRPIQHMLHTIIEEELPVLARMNLVIFTTHDEIGFVTSDHPCARFDPERRRRPPNLESPSIEVTMPISPNSLALLCWSDLPPYKEMSPFEVDNANRLQQMICEESLVVRRNVTKPVWFT